MNTTGYSFRHGRCNMDQKAHLVVHTFLMQHVGIAKRLLQTVLRKVSQIILASCMGKVNTAVTILEAETGSGRQ